MELAKKLDNLRVRRDSYFSWKSHEHPLTGVPIGYDLYRTNDTDIDFDSEISAFTVAELGEMLQKYYASHKEEDCFRCFGDINGTMKSFTANTEADARAKMLIYLLENKLISTGRTILPNDGK